MYFAETDVIHTHKKTAPHKEQPLYITYKNKLFRLVLGGYKFYAKHYHHHCYYHHGRHLHGYWPSESLAQAQLLK